jgi:hypothetical protein
MESYQVLASHESSISSLFSAVRGLSGRSKRLQHRLRRVSLNFLVHLIWNERNRRLFEHVSQSVDSVFRKFQILFFMVLHFHENHTPLLL